MRTQPRPRRRPRRSARRCTATIRRPAGSFSKRAPPAASTAGRRRGSGSLNARPRTYTHRTDDRRPALRRPRQPDVPVRNGTSARGQARSAARAGLELDRGQRGGSVTTEVRRYELGCFELEAPLAQVEDVARLRRTVVPSRRPPCCRSWSSRSSGNRAPSWRRPATTHICAGTGRTSTTSSDAEERCSVSDFTFDPAIAERRGGAGATDSRVRRAGRLGARAPQRLRHRPRSAGANGNARARVLQPGARRTRFRRRQRAPVRLHRRSRVVQEESQV